MSKCRTTKKWKKRRRNRNRNRSRNRAINRKAYNIHHLLFQGRYWNVGARRALRNSFTYSIPIVIHDELHNTLLHDVPRPSMEACTKCYRAYLADKESVDKLDIIEAIEWLMEHMPDENFTVAMQVQYDFFSSTLKGGSDHENHDDGITEQ